MSGPDEFHSIRPDQARFQPAVSQQPLSAVDRAARASVVPNIASGIDSAQLAPTPPPVNIVLPPVDSNPAPVEEPPVESIPSHQISAPVTATPTPPPDSEVAVQQDEPTVVESVARIPGENDEDSPKGTVFEEQQKAYLLKHGDEVRPNKAGPFAFAIVSRAYRELSNGNLSEKLKSAAVQEVPKDEIRLYIAVNNPRLWAVASEVSSAHEDELARADGPDKQRVLQGLIDQRYEELGIEKSDWEKGVFSKGITWQEIQKKIKDYRENQATLRILGEITQTVNALTTHGNDRTNDDSEIQPALQRIEDHARGYLQDAQLQVLLRTAKRVMEERIGVMGVDSSSIGKSYDIQFAHANAANEAAHIAVADGAGFIDVSDMDEYHAPNTLNELYELAQHQKIDFFRRPLSLITPQHPEQLKGSDHIWSALVDYYSESLTRDAINYLGPDNKSSGTTVVSADAFRKHTYPEINTNGDWSWANAMLEDETLVKRYALNSNLLLSHRGRDVSWDGRFLGMSSIKPIDERRQAIEVAQRKPIGRLIRYHQRLSTALTVLHKLSPKSPNFLQIYNDYKRSFFTENQKRREDARRIFLGITKNEDGNFSIDPEGTLAKLYAAYDDKNTVDRILQDAKLKPSIAAFFEQNPLLLPGVAQEIGRLQDKTGRAPTLEEVAKYIETTLPEVFGEPLLEEPAYKTHAVSRPHSGANMVNYMQLAQARDSFIKRIINSQEDGTFYTYPLIVQDILVYFKRLG